MAPARPALLPALFFFAASLASTHVPVGLPPLLGALALAAGFSRRRFDRVLLALAVVAGLVHGQRAIAERETYLADAALSHAVDAPVERSWEDTLLESPKRIDRTHWRLTTRRMTLEVPVADEAAAGLLKRLQAGDRIRCWARVRVDARTRQLRGTIKSSRLIEPLVSPRVSLRDRLQRQRDTLVGRVHEIYGADPRRAAFLAAVLFGDRTFHDPEGDRRLRAAGLAHLVAISGLHVGVVAGCFLGVARRRLRRPFALWTTAALMLVGFGFLVGWAVPVRRSVTGALLALGGRAIGREGDALNRLACVAVVLVWFVPGGATDAAFALSFAATTGILLARAEAVGLRMSLGAWLATAPLCAAYFGQLSPWAPVANLLAVPCITLLLGAGYASIVLAEVPGLGALTAAVAGAACDGIRQIAAFFDSLPASPWFVARPTGAMLLALAASGMTATLAGPRAVRRAAALIFALGIVALHLGPPPRFDVRPTAELLDVGQGQALLWRHRGRVTLIDAGGRGYGRWDPGASVVRPALIDAGLRRLDRLVLSHGDADHAAGAAATLESFEVGEVWLGPGWWRHARLADLAAHARRGGSGIRMAGSGTEEPGIRVVSPSLSDPVREGNAGSLALVLGEARWSLFVPGDLDGPPLVRLVGSGGVEPAAAIVLAHHGSRHGTTTSLLDLLDPGVALVSCGWRNRFGHPHRESLDALAERGVPLWRTDHHGTIRLTAVEDGWAVGISPRSSPGTR